MRFHIIEEALLSHGSLWLQPANIAEHLAEFRSSQKFYFGSVERFPGDEVRWNQFPRLPFNNAAFEIEPMQTGRVFVSIVVHTREFGDRVVAMPFGITPRAVLPMGIYMINRAMSPSGEAHEGVYFVPKMLVGAPREDIAHFAELAAASLAAVGLGLRVLNCINAKTELVLAPERLNRKRAKTGKPPLYEYKVLVLKDSARRLARDGTHQSPRIHLRRGHIKHRRTGDFWWQPCVVGNKERGIVVKDYRADKLFSSSPAGATRDTASEQDA